MTSSDSYAVYLSRVLLLTAVYYIMGRLGLLLAVPPGYATLIWPPSGIALAALIVYGARLWPGIFLGSLIVNLEISGALSFVGKETLVATGIAIGSTVQTLLARYLVREALGIPIVLQGWKDVFRLLALAGPVGCLVAPSVGVATMSFFGVLSADALAHNWLTWWKGDTFGMLVFLPLILIAPGDARMVRWRDHRFGALPVAALLALLIPLGLTFYAWKAIVHFKYEKNAEQFAALAEEAGNALQHRIASYEDALLAASGFFLGSEYVSRAEWRRYVDVIDIGRSYPGMNGLGWIDAVKSADLAGYTQRMRAEGAPDFAVHPDAMPENFIVSYLEPEADNAAAIGLNIAFETNRFAAATRARDTGYATLSRRVQLVQDQSHGPGFVLLMPVYETGRPLGTVENRRAALRGWICAPLIASELLRGLSNTAGHPLSMKVYDGVELPEHLIYSSQPPHARHQPQFILHKSINVGGQQWVLVWESTPAFQEQAASYEHMLVLAGGLLLTALFAGFLMMMARRAQLVQQLVNQRTRQLEKSEEALRSSEETFRSAMEHASIGMALVHPSGNFITVNQALCRLLGYAQAELEGRDFRSITHPEDLDTDLELAGAALSGASQGYEREKRYFHKDGRVIWALLNVSLLRKPDGTPQRFVVQIQDITQRRQMDRMKTEFISTVSHELRTPLTSIRGSLGLIASGALGPLPQKIESMIRIAHTNSERLVRIINDILDIEKIEMGRLELSMRNVPVAAFLKQALEANDAYGARFNVRFVLQAVPEDAEVLADQDRLMQVMANLLSNAAKFSPQGAQVIVRALEDAGKVRIEVEDHGTGIPLEFRPRIFEKFAQADASSSRHFEGTGLGLSITRQLVQAMGGSIGFASEAGIGTTFYFELPRAPAAAPESAAPSAESFPDEAVMRILICGDETAIAARDKQLHRVLHVEDDIDLSKVIGAALSGKVQVDASRTLREAQQRLSEVKYSLVVLDLALPDGNGLSLLDELDQPGQARVPVVILSASEVPRDIQDRVAATLVKSRMSEAHIVETILQVVRREPGPSPTAEAPRMVGE